MHLLGKVKGPPEMKAFPLSNRIINRNAAVSNPLKIELQDEWSSSFKPRIIDLKLIKDIE